MWLNPSSPSPQHGSRAAPLDLEMTDSVLLDTEHQCVPCPFTLRLELSFWTQDKLPHNKMSIFANIKTWFGERICCIVVALIELKNGSCNVESVVTVPVFDGFFSSPDSDLQRIWKVQCWITKENTAVLPLHYVTSEYLLYCWCFSTKSDCALTATTMKVWPTNTTFLTNKLLFWLDWMLTKSLTMNASR